MKNHPITKGIPLLPLILKMTPRVARREGQVKIILAQSSNRLKKGAVKGGNHGHDSPGAAAEIPEKMVRDWRPQSVREERQM